MTRRCALALALILICFVPIASAQDYKPPEPIMPAADVLKEITFKHERLGSILGDAARQGVRDPGLADVQIYHEAVRRLLEHKEFYDKESGEWTLATLDRGLLRARFLSAGEMPWAVGIGFPVVRAYRSRIDGSLQPYAVTLPLEYGKDVSKKWRIDVVLHGRDKSINEVKFLHTFSGDKAATKEQAWVQVDIYGRGNNAYRWAGETDVLEAIDS